MHSSLVYAGARQRAVHELYWCVKVMLSGVFSPHQCRHHIWKEVCNQGVPPQMVKWYYPWRIPHFPETMESALVLCMFVEIAWFFGHTCSGFRSKNQGILSDSEPPVAPPEDDPEVLAQKYIDGVAWRTNQYWVVAVTHQIPEPCPCAVFCYMLSGTYECKISLRIDGSDAWS